MKRPSFSGVGVLADEPAQQLVSEELTVGVRREIGPFAADALSTGVLSSKLVSGQLPSGMKAEVRTNGVYLVGTPSKAGGYQSVLQILSKSATASVPVANLTVNLTVSLLPAWAQGSFNGFVSVGGPVTLTVTAAGKVTGKVNAYGKTYSFSAASYAGGDATNGFSIAATAKTGTESYPVQLTVALAVAPEGMGVAGGKIGGGAQLYLWRNMWVKDDQTLAPFVGYYTATLPGGAAYGSGYLTLTVDKAGKVKTAGKLADGTSLSLNGTLILDSDLRTFVVLYAAPAAYKNGYFAGLVQFVAPEEGGAVYLQPYNGMSLLWFNYNPLAMVNIVTMGFRRYLPGVKGGWYDKTTNLYDYYEAKNLTVGTNTNAPVPELLVGTNRYDSVWWSPAGLALSPVARSGVMTGLAAPAAGKPTDGDGDGVWDYAGTTNAVGLKVTFTRPTGILKGTFNDWFDYPVKKHVSKSLKFEGVLTPVRQDLSDGVEGRGFFLWADKSSYVLVAGNKTVFYTFNWSYDFLLLAQP